ncbi:NAD(P)/FAD-dependent oxidoreductase [Pseudonocardia halophobica]|uniref:NAD(P)/FAD-dependent oxidoreductase n=1 Tax=Pseudonocardia halophobica TaxID=29401 RepID=UPI003D8F13D2
MSISSVTVVGGGLAGFTVARELRSRGFDGALRIVDPQGLPYDRPPLSKGYLAGETEIGDLHLAPPEWYAENSVDIVEDVATKVADGSVVLRDGTTLDADAVVLATGGRARRLPIPGSDLPGVVALRDRADADALREALRPGVRLVIVGAGLIGAEVASTATKAGASVVLVDPVPVPLVPAVGAELAEVLHGMHATHGVEVVEGAPSAVVPDGSALRVELDGRSIPADLVLAAIGLEVDDSLAESVGVEWDGGTVVDELGRTANPAIRAAGDGIRVRAADGTVQRRSEHWEAAMLSGAAAACGLLGEEPPERPPSWFWSDRYGVHVEAVGSMVAPGSTVLRGETVAFRLSATGVLVGCAAIDGGKALRVARRLIARGVSVSPADLADPTVDLRKAGR